ncbi:MAG: thioredoxin fold domain-containing protein [Ignavibacteriaceae bacterium]|nr:thioredoxin fold domain-containing protein [Ignavibacteriaceae bacterium]
MKLRQFLAAFLLFISAVPVMAQFGAENVVGVKFYTSRETVPAGKEVKLAVEMNIESGFHINSNRPKDEFLIPTSVRIKAPAGISLGAMIFPPANDYNFEFSDKPVSVFEGTIYISGLIKVAETVAPGTYQTDVTVEYQACNDQSCMPPKRVTEKVTINVAAKDGKPVEINNSVFARLPVAYSPDKKEEKKEDKDSTEAEAKQLTALNTFLGQDVALPGENLKFALSFKTEKGWKLLSDKAAGADQIPAQISIISEEGFLFSTVTFPDAQSHKEAVKNTELSVLPDEGYIGAFIYIPEEIKPGNYKTTVSFNYQAVNEKGESKQQLVETELSIRVGEKGTKPAVTNADIFSKLNLPETVRGGDTEEDSVSSMLEQSGLFLGLLLVFLGGLALNLTPCVYPLIPITIGYFGGQAEGKTGKLALMGLFYVLGIALTYSVIGVVTAMSGGIFGALLQEWYVLLIIAGVLVTLSLSMFGLYEFKMPDKLVMATGSAKQGYYGAFFMGLTLGIVAAPCIGPFVLGLVTYVAAKQDVLTGFLMFFFMALGLGFPYFILAIFSGKIKNLPRSGVWMVAVKHIFGFVLLGMALYFLLPVIPEPFATYALPVFMVISGIYLIIFDKTAKDNKGFTTFKVALSLLAIVLGGYLIYGAVSAPAPGESGIKFVKYSGEAFDNAKKENRKILIDFYADWCIPCKELDKFTFSDDKVADKSKEFVNLKADLTKSGSDEVKALTEKFEIKGVPTLILIDSSGKEVKRITGFVNAEEFLKILESVR